MTEFIGAKISLISKSDIRYVGILHEINSEESTVALEQVRSFGTEGRRGGDEVPASDNVFEYIVFRGSDVKDLKIEEAAKKVEPPPRGVPDDPAILATTAPPPRSQQSPAYPPMHQYPPPPPGYGNYQYLPPPFGGPNGFRPPPQHMSPPQGFGYPNYPPGMPPPRGFGGMNPPLDQQQQQLPPPPQPPPPQQPQPPPQQVQKLASPPSPVKETKPDVATATAAPPTIKPTPIVQSASKPASVIPAMPISISIPVQPQPIKPIAIQQQQPQQPPESSFATFPQPVVADIAKVTTVADVQSLAKNLRETKLSSSATTDNAPGAGGYLTQPTRRRQFGGASNAPKMDQDYDFESANAKFKKEEIAKEVAAKSTTTNGTEVATEGPSTAQLNAALAEETFYDKGKSFFDNISCENKDRNAIKATQDGTTNPNSWKRGEERKLNMETFGQASVDYGGGRYGRGGYRGGRGGGYRGGGRGNSSGGYSGRGRGGGGNPWRGSGPRANGQNRSSETTS